MQRASFSNPRRSWCSNRDLVARGRLAPPAQFRACCPSHPDDCLEYIGTIFDCIDAFQLLFERSDSLGANCFLVHTARVVITDFLDFWRCLRVDVRVRGLIRDLMQRVVILFGQLVEASPARIFRWHWVALQPAAIGIKIEIILRLHGRIHIFRVQRRRILFDWRGPFSRLLGRLCLCPQAERAKERDEDKNE